MVQKILTPVDGSENANTALEVAADLAAGMGAQLKILHVGLRQAGPRQSLLEAAEYSFDKAERKGGWTSDHHNWPRRLQVLEHMGRMILDNAETCARDRGAAEIETELDWGEEGERILHHAKHPFTDMIVMGSRGAGPLQGVLMGSVSHKVFHLAPCTCVTVHAGKERLGLGTVERILVPFDGSGHAVKAAELACDMAAKFSATVKFVHVLLHGQTPELLLGVVDKDRLDAETLDALENVRAVGGLAMGEAYAVQLIPDAVLKDIGAEVLERAQKIASDKGLSKIETALLDGQPAHSILEAAEKDRADLIVMGMRGLAEVEGLLVGSVSYKVNHLAPCTCIAVR
ncbi:universal stress protein [Pelagibius sp. Alg239-R121]|uniref:universal stress protein n=1 Tax=Pelagibius sp. Alg239-R121 TaxID=2993448 RepID=UPI0024A7911B|nr:universal stress protein [Pelagibius sp. Alg239-R121]